MTLHADTIRLQLAQGPMTSRQLQQQLGLSQATLSRALRAMGGQIVRLGAGSAIHYALHDNVRGLPDMPVYRVTPEGQIQELGLLLPVRPEGFVMCQTAGKRLHSDGLPWWLYDMRPQGYLGRAYAQRHGALLGLPATLSQWTDTHALMALLRHGQDVTGNLLLGDAMRTAYLESADPLPVASADKPQVYGEMAREAAQGELPGSSAGGEQPKFTVYADADIAPQHMIVKFSEAADNSVTRRWRDLLLAEHLALQVLAEQGVAAARSSIVDHGSQRFLEVQRFDRVGVRGRRALFSLAALDAEFVGAAQSGWPAITRQLARQGLIRPEAAEGAALLWAFGTLIGNTDMHTGNLSFISDHGRPYALAPAYDMTPMAFAPRSGGSYLDDMPQTGLHPDVTPAQWLQAEALAQHYLRRLQTESRFDAAFAPCLLALEQHLIAMGRKIRLLAT